MSITDLARVLARNDMACRRSWSAGILIQHAVGRLGQHAAIALAWLFIDVVVANGEPGQDRFAISIRADGEQRPAVRTRETPCQ